MYYVIHFPNLYAGDEMNYSLGNMSYYNGKLVDGKTYMVFQRVHTTEVHYHGILEYESRD